MKQLDPNTETQPHFDHLVEEVLAVLKNGGVILYPTDTIWGLGCDSFLPASVDKVFQIKQRPKEKNMVLLVADVEQLKQYVKRIHPRLETLLFYHERPMTVIYKDVKDLPEHLLAKDGSVAIRIVKDSFCQKLIHKLNRPLISTSANIHGEPFPPHFGAISSAVIRAVDHVVKWRQHEEGKNKPSVIVTLKDNGDLEFIRN